MTTTPLKITAKLLDGRVNTSDGLIYLDAILYHAWFLKYDPKVLTGEKKGTTKHYGLPLLNLPNNQYAASVGFYEEYDQNIEYWNKRPRWDKHQRMLNTDKGKIKTSVGLERAYRMPQIIRTISDPEFYCIGTKEKIIDLLSYIPAIGKKPSAGWGKVIEWTVEDFEEDWTVYSDKYGIMRPLPIDVDYPFDTDSYRIEDLAIRPPSWKIKNQQTCYMPEVIVNGTR